MKRTSTILLMLLCVGAGALRGLDLTRYTDLSHDFIQYGPYWIRYVILALLLMEIGAVSLKLPKNSTPSTEAAPVQGGLCLLTGMGFAALSGLRLTQFGQTDSINRLLTILFLLSGVWFLLLGYSRLSSQLESPTYTAWMGILGTLSLYLLTIQRFCVNPSGVVRVGSTLASLASLAALLFAAAQAKAAYVPEKQGGRWLYFTGFAVFLLADCLALPGAAAEFMIGQIEVAQLAEAIALALLGLCGLAAAFAAQKRPAAEPDEPETNEKTE